MTAEDTLAGGALAWLNHTGQDVVYQSKYTGLDRSIRATLERAVTTVDDIGTVTSGTVVSALATDVQGLARGDAFDIDGYVYRVDEVLDDGGFLLRAFVSRGNR